MSTAKVARVALVEDDPIMGEALLQRLRLEGFRTEWSRAGAEALGRLTGCPPDLVVCDIKLPDLTGEQLFDALGRQRAETPFIFVTGFADLEQAVRLTKKGAADYLTKPFAIDALLERIRSTLAPSRPASAATELGVSPAMQRMAGLLLRVADIDSHVLLTGETGVGKEVAARFLHAGSRRQTGPFVAVNCAAIPAELVESELLGHERGAFTGAQARHPGYAERAGGGVLFLDEIGELPLPAQAKLLRLVQERSFHRIGGEALIPFDARLVCATNRDLEALVQAGRFREDLLYRINVIPVTIPPLRERREDIVPLLQLCLQELGRSFGRQVAGFAPGAKQAALDHRWPGNVRELRNRVERAVALAEEPWIGRLDLFPEQQVFGHAGDQAEVGTLAAARDAAERQQIEHVLLRTGGRLARTAELLGVSRTTLWERMRRFGIASEA